MIVPTRHPRQCQTTTTTAAAAAAVGATKYPNRYARLLGLGVRFPLRPRHFAVQKSLFGGTMARRARRYELVGVVDDWIGHCSMLVLHLWWSLVLSPVNKQGKSIKEQTNNEHKKAKKKKNGTERNRFCTGADCDRIVLRKGNDGTPLPPFSNVMYATTDAATWTWQSFPHFL